MHQKLIKFFNNYIPIHIIPTILKEKDIDIVSDEIVNNENFEKSDTEIETYESLEEWKFPQKYDDGGNIIVEDLKKIKWMIHECKQCLKDQDTIIYLSS